MTAEVAIIGGTGKLGAALAARLARAGHAVVIGSRDEARAHAAAERIVTRLGGDVAVRGVANAAAAAVEGVVILAVPYEGLDEILGDIAPAIGERVVVSTVAPVRFIKGDGPTHVDVPQGSACELIAGSLPGASVVGALQTVSYVTLAELDSPLHGDIIVTGDDDQSKAIVAALLTSLGEVRVVDGGRLRNSRYVEQLTVLLLSINRRYRRNTGVRIANLPDELVAWNAPATAGEGENPPSRHGTRDGGWR